MTSVHQSTEDHGQIAYIRRIVETLRDFNGVAKAAAVKTAVVTEMEQRGEFIDETPLPGGDPKYWNDMRWARMYLVNAGILEPAKQAGYGTWKLTDKGWTTPLDPSTVQAIYSGNGKKQKKIDGDAVAPNVDGQRQLIKSWETQLAKILVGLPDKGFERLCAAVMTANGVEATKMTGKSGDGGIDGEGLIALDHSGLVTVRVAWQCKRFADKTVSPSAIRDFRGALDSSTSHGVFFTTSEFTPAATAEASIPGKKPIRLINLQAFVELLDKLNLGVMSAREQKAVDHTFFKQYQNPAGGDDAAPQFWPSAN